MLPSICVRSNGEQTEVATRTMMAAAIVSSTAIYLIYKKKIAQRDGYNGYNIGSSMRPASFNLKFGKKIILCALVVFVIIVCVIFLKRNELQSVGFSSRRREQENLRRQNYPDSYAHHLRHNPLYNPQPYARYHGRR